MGEILGRVAFTSAFAQGRCPKFLKREGVIFAISGPGTPIAKNMSKCFFFEKGNHFL